MNCDKIRRLLTRYIDQELEDKEVSALIEEHLNLCPHCRAQVTSLLSIKGLLGQKEKVAAQEDFLARLKAKLAPQAQILRIKWLPQAGELARRLIPVPVVTMLLMLSFIFSRLNGTNPVDEYILADLNNEEISILSGYIDNSDLLAKVVFE